MKPTNVLPYCPPPPPRPRTLDVKVWEDYEDGDDGDFVEHEIEAASMGLPQDVRDALVPAVGYNVAQSMTLDDLFDILTNGLP